jgi:hypothetical protein
MEDDVCVEASSRRRALCLENGHHTNITGAVLIELLPTFSESCVIRTEIVARLFFQLLTFMGDDDISSTSTDKDQNKKQVAHQRMTPAEGFIYRCIHGTRYRVVHGWHAIEQQPHQQKSTHRKKQYTHAR